MEIRELFHKLCRAVKRYGEEYNCTCDLCGSEVFRNERICADCMDALPFYKGEICPFCGRAVGEAGTCLQCKQKPLKIKRARSLFVHEGEPARLVVRFKQGDKFLYRTLASLLAERAQAEFADCDLVIGVPMTEVAEKKRGYNQSYLLAKEVARLTGKTYLAPVVKRKQTEEQKSLGREAREKNLQGSFHVADRAAVKGKRVLIVDDTLTTGSTCSVLAEALYGAKCAQVDCLTVTSVRHKIIP